MTTVPPFVLVAGPEQVLAERAVASTVALIRESDGGAEVVRLDGPTYDPGSLAMHTSPSLFGGRTVVVVRDLDEGTDALIDDVVALASADLSGAHVIAVHKGGQRGKRALDALRKAGARVIDAPALKSDRDRASFITNEFRVARRKITGEAVQALMEAIGRDLRELAAACSQLIADTTGTVEVEQVEQYYGGKVEVTGFRIAEAAVAGNSAEAVRLLRAGLTNGLVPVQVVAVLAGQLRQVARVATARGSAGSLAKELGMAPWRVDRARTAARGWDGQRLGRAIQAVAAADFEVKGGGRDPVYAVERAILTICAEQRGVAPPPQASRRVPPRRPGR